MIFVFGSESPLSPAQVAGAVEAPVWKMIEVKAVSAAPNMNVDLHDVPPERPRPFLLNTWSPPHYCSMTAFLKSLWHSSRT